MSETDNSGLTAPQEAAKAETAAAEAATTHAAADTAAASDAANPAIPPVLAQTSPLVITAVSPIGAITDPAAVVAAPVPEQVAVVVASTLATHDWLQTLSERLTEVEDKVMPVAESGAFGAPVAAGATLLQEVINFLHHTFPGHGVPGTPSVPPPAPAPAI